MVLDPPKYSAAFFSNTLLHKRLELIMIALQKHPGCSLSQACRSLAAREAACRFVDHPATTGLRFLLDYARSGVIFLSHARFSLVFSPTHQNSRG